MKMTGFFKTTLPFKSPNTRNLKFECSCKLLNLIDEGSYQYFSMAPRCLKHIMKYIQWKIANKSTPMNGLKLTYIWNVYNNGTTGIIE